MRTLTIIALIIALPSLSAAKLKLPAGPVELSVPLALGNPVEFQWNIENINGALIAELTKGDSLSHEARACIMHALGCLRDPSSVPILVKNISLKTDTSRHMVRGDPLWGNYPATDALMRIGICASDEVLQALTEETRELERKLFLGVFKHYHGDATEAVLRRALDRAKLAGEEPTGIQAAIDAL